MIKFCIYYTDYLFRPHILLYKWNDLQEMPQNYNFDFFQIV